MKYECHITIDPVTGDSLKLFTSVCEHFKFKVANLLKVDGTGNDKDQFTTGHGNSYADLKQRMIMLGVRLKADGFKLRRYKIEEIMMDSRLGDSEGLL